MKYLLFLAIKSQAKKSRGFTLIELLIVVILLGVLAAISLPSLLGQIAKGRQAEARASLGLINRAQQGYRYEKGTFATLSELALEAATISLTFYNISEVGTPNPVGVAYKLDALTPFDDDIKNYAGAAGQTAAGAYTGIVCEDETPLEDNVSASNDDGVLSCVNGVRIN
ncbi:MAG: prepilin-type N-terminal cleavage/methylation domain-containing protein [Microcystis panniformis Mp_MB_F_20051200_S9]|uniref:Prepilin-type N-terminal cleavage/methylation domain-containing protein n=1 Tax=Microcystis panniformis Mp_MB_F_20051200_S9 TaxID=2486223 RepID=A0A552QA95_9CHRO|nr:MAG: prepilin-type N-terminal cleavage/methylation domain-containing protein [Microcystis panniformis Mp_GB_SS_20050300_S99]TRV48186.1 MAG: prepilin-type N-terminal cleavage/methylation domain-containing protein [Microcystis panniformis Mp_MB_F_20080800_S26D]TRV48527.1 MAG: prepilin-type N-terminal cleavage/methylation domain-containing protein [Microcystis panniformis Mp_GB_SS_20050300_S99D]TRV59118.1 MAG: prepilin-type N-terminal cleavage/methylation domain-containing protein [Microcystis p